jgi:surface antigen
MVFAAGQDGSSAQYGHVAIVESIGADGSITTSESGAVLGGRTISRTFSAKSAAEHSFIHY